MCSAIVFQYCVLWWLCLTNFHYIMLDLEPRHRRDKSEENKDTKTKNESKEIIFGMQQWVLC